MTNKDILSIAMEQSATDLCCRAADFQSSENVIVRSKTAEGARKYLKLPFSLQMVSYGSNIVASCTEEFEAAARSYLKNRAIEHCFETPNIHILEKELNKQGQSICFMAEYFLPNLERLKALQCGYDLKVLHHEDFKELYLPQWSNALCKERAELDVIGVGAYKNGELIGFAGASADCESMYQIGIDVLPEFRRQGIASALTSRLALEILDLGKVPFYCAAWCNVKSVRNAVKSGFVPAWCEMTAKDIEFVNKMM